MVSVNCCATATKRFSNFFGWTHYDVGRKKAFQCSWAFVIVETQKKKKSENVGGKKIDELSTTKKKNILEVFIVYRVLGAGESKKRKRNSIEVFLIPSIINM